MQIICYDTQSIVLQQARDQIKTHIYIGAIILIIKINLDKHGGLKKIV